MDPLRRNAGHPGNLTSYESATLQSILSFIHAHLRDTYDVELPTTQLAPGAIPLREVAAAAAFRSDPVLDELRGALARLDDGSFGVCLGCKTRMAPSLMASDPVRRFCPDCERRLHQHTCSNFNPTYSGVEESF